MLADRLDELGVAYCHVNQRRFLQAPIEVFVSDGSVSGRVGSVALADARAVYMRLANEQMLPEVEAEPPDSPVRRAAADWCRALVAWSEVTSARVVTRHSAQSSNASKPFQAQIISQVGFSVPPTLITNEPELAREFWLTHGTVVYKSISSCRSIVSRLTEDDIGRLERIRWCPVQFQAWIPGTDVRVHVVGEEVFATLIESDATDYRYAARQGSEPARLSEYTLDALTKQRCLNLSERLSLSFVGIDLRITSSGEAYCFEANPSPGYPYYETSTGQPISLALARYLSSA